MDFTKWSPVVRGGAEGSAAASQELLAETLKNNASPKRFDGPEEFANLVEAVLRTPFPNGRSIRPDGVLATRLTPVTPPGSAS